MAAAVYNVVGGFKSFNPYFSIQAVFPRLTCRTADVFDLECPVVTLSTSCKSKTFHLLLTERPFVTNTVRLGSPAYHPG